jgi:phosphohistidine phosphatase
MDLILWRHAEAENGEPDMERALTAKGLKQANKMGQWLDRNLPGNCKILCSPARRTVQTVEALGRKYKIIPEIEPGAAPEAVLRAANWPDAREPVLVVGHQPTLGMVAALLIAGRPHYWTIRKANVWWISSQDKEDGEGGNTIRAVMAGEFLGK